MADLAGDRVAIGAGRGDAEREQQRDQRRHRDHRPQCLRRSTSRDHASDENRNVPCSLGPRSYVGCRREKRFANGAGCLLRREVRDSIQRIRRRKGPFPMKPIVRSLAGSPPITVLVAGPALAQGYPPGAQTIEVSDSVVIPCQMITVRAEPGAGHHRRDHASMAKWSGRPWSSGRHLFDDRADPVRHAARNLRPRCRRRDHADHGRRCGWAGAVPPATSGPASP